MDVKAFKNMKVSLEQEVLITTFGASMRRNVFRSVECIATQRCVMFRKDNEKVTSGRHINLFRST